MSLHSLPRLLQISLLFQVLLQPLLLTSRQPTQILPPSQESLLPKFDSLISQQVEELPTTIQRVSLDGMEPQQMLPKVQTSTILLHDSIQTSQVVVQRILQKVLISISQMLVLAQLSVSHDHLLTIIVRGYSGSISQARQLMGISHLRIGILLTPRKMFSHLVLDSLV